MDEIYVCDPRENALISQNARKSDRADVYNLCRLLRLDELKEVYHPTEDHRAVFKRVSPRSMLLANGLQAAAARREKGDRYVRERGVSLSQESARFRLIAAAVATCCRCVFSRPR